MRSGSTPSPSAAPNLGRPNNETALPHGGAVSFSSPTPQKPEVKPPTATKNSAHDKRATNTGRGKWGPQRRNACRKGGALTPGARSCALPRPTFLRQKEMRKFGNLVFGEGLRPSLLSFKREDDGREGAICGRLARKATGVSPSGFARTGVFAGTWIRSISPDSIILFLLSAPSGRDSVEIPRTARPTEAMESAGFPRNTVFAEKLSRELIRRPIGALCFPFSVLRSPGAKAPYSIQGV